MNLTITSDASYSNKYQVGTYAFMVVSNLGRHRVSGVLKNNLASPSQAEMKCICNALFFVSKDAEVMEKAKRIYINTDSMNAIHLFTEDDHAIQKWGLKKKSYKKIFNTYTSIKKLFVGKEIVYSHIKAHKSTATPAQWCNDWADKAAKEEMSKKLKSLNAKKETDIYKKCYSDLRKQTLKIKPQNDKPNSSSPGNKLHQRSAIPVQKNPLR